ncbi:MAG: hypothetical protein FVQ80_08510 [Planctomycetes bacterium]|nr:hypothetical protein [Planctomycetota bacterium]
MAITDSDSEKNCGDCKHWGDNNGPYGRCSQHFLPVSDPANLNQKVRSITIDTWVCEKFEKTNNG